MPWSPPTHTYRHQRKARAQRIVDRRRQQREYNKTRPEEHRIYGTQRWKRVRLAQLRRNPVCQMCGIRAGAVADHITPVMEGGAWFDPENLQSLCVPCHAEKSAADKAKKIK